MSPFTSLPGGSDSEEGGSSLNGSAELSPLTRAAHPGRRLKRVNLVQEVVQSLREEILAGTLPAGEALPAEGQLCHTFGVSRTVVREAMRTLRAQGLVEVSQGKRPRVKPADPQAAIDTMLTYLQRGDHSLRDLLEVRWPLETEIARLAAQRATDQQIAEMDLVIQRQTESTLLDHTVRADLEFHNLLAAASGNPLFELLLTTLTSLMRKSRYATIARSGGQWAAAGHLEILTAVRNRDPEGAHRAMAEHLRRTAVDLDLTESRREGSAFRGQDAGTTI